MENRLSEVARQIYGELPAPMDDPDVMHYTEDPMSDTQTIAAIQSQLKVAGGSIARASVLTATLSGTPSDVISTPAGLDAALAKATPGATLVLSPTLLYPTPLTLSKGVTLRSTLPIIGRATLETPMPTFKAGAELRGTQLIAFYGLAVRHTDPHRDLLTLGLPGLGDAHRLIDGCRVLGDVILGGKRGIAANAADVTVTNSYVEDCFGTMPGDDTQAFCAWDSPGPFLIENNYFSGGSETFLLGGADPSSPTNIPSHGIVRGNVFTKRPQWQSMAIGVKNTFEMKNAIDWLVENNDISQSWGQHGQDGYLLMLTPRNQGNTAPYSTLRDISIRKNRFSYGAGWVALLGHDAPNVSAALDGLVLDDNDVTNLDPWKMQGTGGAVSGTTNKCISIGDGVRNTKVTNNRVAGRNFGSSVYLSGDPKDVALTLTNNVLPPSEYGLMGGGAAPDVTLNDPTKAWAMYVGSGTLSGNTTA